MASASFEGIDARMPRTPSKHGVSFVPAQHAFADPHRVIAEDGRHSIKEQR
jgi:uncharacterized DUF497 family protein